MEQIDAALEQANKDIKAATDKGDWAAASKHIEAAKHLLPLRAVKAGIDPSDLLITVAPDQVFEGKRVPGAVQVDYTKGPHAFSGSPEEMINNGFEMPTSEDLKKLPAGQYRLAGAIAALRGEPERITAAAYRTAQGKTETGPHHPGILERLGIKGFESRESRNTPDFGYQTNLRVFVPRGDEAAQIAKEANQQLEPFDVEPETGKQVPHSDQVAAEPGGTTPLSETTPAETKPVASLSEAWKLYDTADPRMGTVSDLADAVEGLIGEGKAPDKLQAAVDRYRKAVEEDFKMAGRSDLQGAEERFLKAVERASKQKPKPTVPETPANVTKPGEPVTPAEIESRLKVPVPDVTEERQRVRAIDNKQAELRQQREKIGTEIKEIEKRILGTRGYSRGRIKSGAKKADVARYRDLQKELGRINGEHAALDNAARADRALIDRRVDAEIINDPRQNFVRRIDRLIRMLQDDKETVPPELVQARDAEVEKLIRAKYPDATPDEIKQLAPEVTRSVFFANQDPFKEPNSIPKIPEMRRSQLAKAYEGEPPGNPTHLFPAELKDKLSKYLASVRTYGGKVPPGAPVEDLSAKDLASLRREISTTSDTVRKRLQEEEEARVKREAEEKAKEEQLLGEAQKVADSAKRTGTVGGRTAKDVKSDLIRRVKGAVDEMLQRDPVTLTRGETEGGVTSYTAQGKDALAFGEVQPTPTGTFKVTANRPSAGKYSTTVDTLEEAEWFIRALAAEGGGKTIIGVPGDGVFRILRSGPSLLKTWIESRKLDVSKGRSPSTSSAPSAEKPPKVIKTLADWKQARDYHGFEDTDKIAGWSPALREVAKKVNPANPERVTAADVEKKIADKSGTGGQLHAFGPIPAVAKVLGQAARPALRKIQVLRGTLAQRSANIGERHQIDQLMDAADTQANEVGVHGRNHVALGISSDADLGASAAIAAGMDPKNLPKLLAIVAGKNADAERAVRYAMAHWAEVEPAARRGQALFDAEIAQEKAAGMDTLYAENYLPGLYDTDLWMGKSRPFVIGQSGGAGSQFRKGKTYETPFHAVGDGYEPKTLRLSELVEHRLRQGQRLINRRAFVDSLRSINATSDGRPIVADMIQHSRGPGLPAFETPPVGYVPRQIIPGTPTVAIHEDFARLVDALTGTSKIGEFEPRGIPVGSLALATAGGIKHGLLVFDTFHASRILQKSAFTLRGLPSYRKGMSLLDYADPDLNRAIAAREITPEMANWVRANRPTANLLLKSGLNVGRIQELIYNSTVRGIQQKLAEGARALGVPKRIAEKIEFNKWVFEKVTRGAMMEGALHEFDRVKKQNPEMTDSQVAFKVARDINVYFGNLGRQGIFKSQTFLDASRLAFLAPQWVESMARSELIGAGQLLKAPVDSITAGRLRIGTLGGTLATGLLGYAIGTQILNLLTRGHLTFQNQEKEHKWDAWIPDITGKGNGFFLSPLSVPAELTHDMIRYTKMKDGVLPAAWQIVKNRMAPLPRAARAVFEGRDWNDRQLGDTWERVKAGAWALAPTPIPLSPVLRGNAPEGQVQRQLTSSLGFKTEPAGSGISRTHDLIKDWLKASSDPKLHEKYEQAKKQDFGESEYRPLKDSLNRGDLDRAIDEYHKLITEKGKKEKDVFREMKPYTMVEVGGQFVRHDKPFAGLSRKQESQFLRSLSPEDRVTYDRAKKERLDLFQRFQDMLKQEKTRQRSRAAEVPIA